MDNYKNFAYSTVSTAPSPADSGTSLTIGTDDNVFFPDAPFNVTVWPAATAPLASNAEIMRVTDVTGDVFTVTRAQENTSAREVVVGDQIAAAVTEKTLTDLESTGGATEVYAQTSVPVVAADIVWLDTDSTVPEGGGGGGGGGGAHTVGTTAPSSPAIGDIWFKTS